MQTTTITNYAPQQVAGGRVAGDAYRESLAQCRDFAGLEEGADRYALLLLVKRVGKLAGFTPRMIALLDYYLAFTRDCDWEEGGRPIVYQSLSRSALDLGISERMVQKLEAALFAAGALAFHDSGNHRRYGQRCQETGRILYAYGPELTPLAYLRPALEAKLYDKRLHDDAWLDAKRAISACRRQIRAHLAEWEQGADVPTAELRSHAERYDQIAVQLRTHLSLADMRSLLAQHEALESDLKRAMGVDRPETVEAPQRPKSRQETPIGSPTSEPGFAPYKSTTQQTNSSCSRDDGARRGSVAEGPAPERQSSAPGAGTSGLEHVKLRMALAAASDRLSAHLPLDPGWDDVVEAAYRLRTELGVSQQSWGEACAVLGRSGAAVVLLVTDRAALSEKAQLRSPAAYFRGLVRRATQGELRLHASLFGLLGRGRGEA